MDAELASGPTGVAAELAGASLLTARCRLRRGRAVGEMPAWSRRDGFGSFRLGAVGGRGRRRFFCVLHGKRQSPLYSSFLGREGKAIEDKKGGKGKVGKQ